MPKVQLNPSLDGVHAAIVGWVYKYYPNDNRGQMLSRRTDMSKVRSSPAQLARRQLMREAGAFHWQVLKVPVLLKKYQRIAKLKRTNLFAACSRGIA